MNIVFLGLFVICGVDISFGPESPLGVAVAHSPVSHAAVRKHSFIQHSQAIRRV